MSESPLDLIRFDAAGLAPAVVQDAHTGRVLMLGYMNREAVRRTLETRLVWFYSRSRQRLWQKGESSGNVLRLVSLTADCDGDALLAEAEPAGPTCHTGAPSCFFNAVEGEPPAERRTPGEELLAVIKQRQRERPEGSYVAKLFNGGVDRIAKKIGEEAGEVIIAAKNADPDELTREMADLWFHCYVLLADAGVEPEAIWAELAKRRR